MLKPKKPRAKYLQYSKPGAGARLAKQINTQKLNAFKNLAALFRVCESWMLLQSRP